MGNGSMELGRRCIDVMRALGARALALGGRGSVSLARSSLLYEWKRYLPAILAVAFAGLLMIVQLGLLLGIFSTVSVVVDRARADLWVGFPNTPSFDLGRTIAERQEMVLRMHPEVVAVEPMIVGYADWRGPKGNPVSAVIIGIDPHADSVGTPDNFPASLRLALQEPDSVAVDEVDLRKLGVRVGEAGEINGKQGKIVGVVSGFRNIGGAYMFCSVSTARRMLGLFGMEPGFTTYLLVKLADPRRAERVRDQLQPGGAHPPFTVWTAPEFSARSQSYWLTESGAGASFGFSTLLGLTVGIVITSQTLMAAIMASLREYATLRALGVSRRALAAVVVEQSWWVGLIGLVLAAFATAIVWALARLQHVGMVLPWWGIVGTVVISIIVALGSSVFALRALFRAEPAELLR